MRKERSLGRDGFVEASLWPRGAATMADTRWCTEVGGKLVAVAAGKEAERESVFPQYSAANRTHFERVAAKKHCEAFPSNGLRPGRFASAARQAKLVQALTAAQLAAGESVTRQEARGCSDSVIRKKKRQYLEKND